MRRAFLIPLLLALVVTSGCGYALVGRAANLPEDVREVWVQPLQNRTPRAQVDQFLTRALADELVTRKRFSVLNSPEGADALLRGAVTAFGVTPVSFDEDGRATEYEISITASMELKRPGEEGEVLWSNDRYIFRQSYPVETGDLEYFDREDLALEEAAGRFAETMVTDLLEGF